MGFISDQDLAVHTVKAVQSFVQRLSCYLLEVLLLSGTVDRTFYCPIFLLTILVLPALVRGCNKYKSSKLPLCTSAHQASNTEQFSLQSNFKGKG